MCGISGIMGPQQFVNRDVQQALAQSLAHRGPDDEGIESIHLQEYSGRVLSLIHRRLSIIDLSELGHQPMKDPSTGNWIVYNGEIYNFKKIRQDLKKKGISFLSRSDTEVILKAYAIFGIECLSQLCGMFAFAIWDEEKQELVLARDRLGIKPLYYYVGDNGLFLFASELRALLATGLVPRKINPLGLESYLAYGAVQAPLTIIKDVHCLLPAHYLVVHSDGTVGCPQCYWSPQFASSELTRHEKPYSQAEFRYLLEDVIQEHLISDVPIGAFLSGGVDSSSVVALMNQVAPDVVYTFSVTFQERDFSEAPYSQVIAKKYSKHHTEICLSEQQLLALLPEALSAIDQPTIDGINVYVISKKVREAGLKVVLSGQGGDEIFGGYSTFRYLQQIMRYRLFLKLLPRGIKALLARLWFDVNGGRILGNKISEILTANNDVLHIYLILRQLFLPKARQNLFSNVDSTELVNGLSLEATKQLEKELQGLDVVNKVSLLELRTYLANMLLRDGDFMSMAHGLEIRVPFLDHRLVEFVTQIPGQHKLARSMPKPILIKAMGDLLPPEIYQRPKRGFTFPWEYWLRNELRYQLERLLANSDAAANIGLNPQICQRVWNGFLKNEPGITWSRVWALFVLMDWCERMEVTA